MAMSKTKSLRKHTTRRADERYEVRLNEYDLAYMANQVKRATGIFVERQSNRVSKWIIKLPKVDKAAMIVYDHNRGTVVTVLPKRAMPHPASELGCRARALELSRADAAGIIEQIRDKRAVRGAGKYADGRTEWTVTKPSTGEEITVLYHRGYDIISSVLTLPAPEPKPAPEPELESVQERDMEEDIAAPSFC